MLSKKLTIKDLESIDPEFYNSLIWIRLEGYLSLQHFLETVCLTCESECIYVSHPETMTLKNVA